MTTLPGKADLHIHTFFSDGLMSPEALVEYAITQTDLDVIAVTDHDTIAGALVAQAYARFFSRDFRPFEVIVGTEVTSADGDILALFVESDIAPGMSAADTLGEIHRQGGVAIAAHPFAHAPTLLRMDGMKGAGRLIADLPFDGVEVRNGTPTEWVSNPWTAFRNRQWAKRTETGGSDTHYLPTVGSTFTRFPGKTAQDLRRAIETSQTSAGGRVYSPLLIVKLLRQLGNQELPARHLPEERSARWVLSAAN
ncbi:MAG: PHP domain-containing protein [Chloroflexi bacterium]|nr:PHP domain-containing protein [Chloroflexota bacterium]